jgi:hypothetical protein
VAPVGALIVVQKLMAVPVAVQGAIIWRNPAKKLTVALATVLTYNYMTDIFVVALWLAAVAVMVRAESLRLLQLDWLPIATSIFLILYIGLPDTLGTTASVDSRVLVPLLICVIALIVRLPPRRATAGAALVLIATLVRTGGIDFAWERYGRIDAQHLTFIRGMPIGSRILGLQFPYVDRFKNDFHVISWAVPERQAMVSSLFAISGQQPLHISVNEFGPFMRFSDKGLEVDGERVRAASFDYVWFFNASDITPTVPTAWTRVYGLSSITVWKVR